MGTLKIDNLNFNDSKIINDTRKIIKKLIKKPQSIFQLKFKEQYYFEVPNGPLPEKKGWYIILNERRPIYIGTANNLDGRLNSNNGSIDDFANTSRSSDSIRNFIKKFNELGIFSNLEVVIITEQDFCQKFNSKLNELTNVDRLNLEKFMNIFRLEFDYT